MPGIKLHKNKILYWQDTIAFPRDKLILGISPKFKKQTSYQRKLTDDLPWGLYDELLYD